MVLLQQHPPARLIRRLVRDGPSDVVDAALLRAVERRHSAEVIECLLDQGADVSALNDKGLSPLHMASTPETCEALVRRGANLSAESRGARSTPLFLAVLNEQSPQVVETLVRLGAKVNIGNKCGYTPLHVAKSRRVCELLLESGAILEQKDADGYSPLALAVAYEHPTEVIACMLERGAKVNTTNRVNSTPLHMVKSRVVAEMLLQHGADLERLDATVPGGASPLFSAVANDHPIEVIACFLDHGAEMMKRPPELGTVLHLVKSRQVCASLLRRGARVDAVDAHGLTPPDRAFLSGALDVVDYLLFGDGESSSKDAKREIFNRAKQVAESKRERANLEMARDWRRHERVLRRLGLAGISDPVDDDEEEE